MAIRDNIVTPQVRADGFGAVDTGRLFEAIEQIGSVHQFKAEPRPEGIFEGACLPPAGERRVN